MKNQHLISNLLILVACIGMFLSTLDTGIMNIALPFFTRHFATTTNVATFSISGYTMTLAAVIMLFGVLSDKAGKLKISLFGLIVFGLSSLLAGFSPTMSFLIGVRIVQGVGAAGLQATSIALITTFVDKAHLHAAIGTLGVAIGLGPVLGPSVGGLFLALGDWRWIFWVNLPVVLVALFANLYLLKNVEEKRRAKLKIDGWGALLTGLAIVCFLSGMTSLKTALWLGVILILSALILVFILFQVEKHSRQPLFSLSEYRKSQNLGLFLSETTLFGLASALIFLLPPFILEKVLGVNAGLAGLFVLGTPVGLVIFSKLSGKWNDGKRSRAFSRLGLVLMMASFILLLLFHQVLFPALITLFLLIYGIGGGFFQPANIALISGSVPTQIHGEVGSLQRMVQNIGISVGAAVGGIFLTFNRSLIVNINYGWELGILLLIIILTMDFLKNKSIKSE